MIKYIKVIIKNQCINCLPTTHVKNPQTSRFEFVRGKEVI